ncbi:TPA: LOW QUALITY PROTEIN: hypothetical protein N0F65_008246 [Lagenidium giganteum]|uniref:Peptidase A2 domain-containing protein n=1 Tax=Lagenidium giganteum TaxID=4803 RepID=A0AAV2YZI0_9STRA|nr:TPA: LOW QUALITY PROTEIN: hypothetical protein N0F65_008246 [Lagenidium giganteum]
MTPVYELVNAPRLVKWDQAALMKWYRAWQQYLVKIDHRWRVMATVKGCNQPDVLSNMAAFVLQKDVTEVTDAMIMAGIEKRCKTIKNGYMDMSNDDCEGRVFAYFQSFNETVECNGLQSRLGRVPVTHSQFKDRTKLRCKLLMENLHPAFLRTQIERLVEYEHRECRTDDVQLYNLTLEHAEIKQRYHYDVNPPNRTSGPQRTDRKAPKPDKRDSPQSGEHKTPRDDCLVCGGAHWMRHYPTATDEQKKRALEKLRGPALRPMRTVTVNGLVNITDVVDSGADRCMVPHTVIEMIKEADKSLVVRLVAHVV